MTAYEEYKDSGVIWIGDIPADWHISKIGNFHTTQLGKMLQPNQKNTTDSLETYLCAANIKERGINLEPHKEMWFSISDKDVYDIKKGDLLVVEGGDVGLCSIYNFQNTTYIQNALHRIRETSLSQNRFLYYWMLFVKSSGYMDLICNKATIAHYTKEKLINTPYVVLNIKIQQKIADYLDKKTSSIDSLIADKQKLIELLQEKRQAIISETVTKGLDKTTPMKDSGIPWIGEIPENWGICKFRYLVNKVSDVDHYMPKTISTGKPYIMTGDLKEKASDINFNSCKQIDVEDYEKLSVKSKPKVDDVIFARYATIGTICYVDIDLEFLVSYSCVTINPNQHKLLGKYLFYFLKSDVFAEDIIQYINSNTQSNVGIESLYKVKIPVLPIKDQQKIADYLDEQTSEIDLVITDITSQIEKLKEYRQAIISEVVTGKVMV